MNPRPVRLLVPVLVLTLAWGIAHPLPSQEPPASPPPVVVVSEEPIPAGEPGGPPALPPAGTWLPDRAEAGSVEAIRGFTTAPQYLPESVAYVPDSDTVPSPSEILGHVVGAPDVLSRVADIHGYFRQLDAASDRVRVQVIGQSEEGREMLLAMISDPANLDSIDRHRDITARLADPRRTPREEMRRLAEEGKVFYYLLGGLHSTETGSPEMLMELAYRLAVSEKPEIRAIRENAIVLITPVVEPDGRDRVVDWYERHLKGKSLVYEDFYRGFSNPPYWGHYAFHDNNRDGMQLTLALTRAVNDTFFTFHPQVVHDLHESVPLLYISTGHGPYSRAVNPVTINEWTEMGVNEAGALSAQGMPGVWIWGFWDGWWPGYLFSVANNHHSIGRFYETFGNSHPGTFERDLSGRRYANGKPATEVQWFRPWPPEKKLRWSLRNNTNYMQAGVLEALEHAAKNRRELLESFWTKGNLALEKGKSEPPYAWIFPPEQRDPGRFAYLVNQLQAHRIEVHRLTAELRLGKKTWAPGSVVVRLDQLYGPAARNFLEEQKFPDDEPNPPYDDVAWTWPLLYGVTGEPVSDKGVLAAALEPISGPVMPEGRVDGEGEVFLLPDRGQNAFLQARLLLGNQQVDAAEAEFSAGGATWPAGSWIVQAPREAVAEVARQTGLIFTGAAFPDVKRHPVDLPRLALYHTWTDTQDAGWARYTLDREKLPYTLINDDDLKRGNLGGRFDVIYIPETGGGFAAMVHGIDPKNGPLAYTKTAEFPSHGVPDASEDITGGMGFAGLLELQRFLQEGGVLVAAGNAGTLAVDGGLVRGVNRTQPAGVENPGSELQAKVRRPEHPIAYGFEELPSIFRGNGPLYEVDKRDRRRVVLQLGTKRPEGEEDEGKKSGEIEVEDVDTPGEEAPAKKEEKPARLVLSGYVKNGDKGLDGKPAILDVPAGKGRVILFAFNPLHRYLNHSDFRFFYNVLLHWNDLPD